MGATADGMTTEIHHPNWEMYNDSIYNTGNHPEVGCLDCHMASREYNDTTHEIAGHTFDYEPELLFSLESSGECYDCHDEEFAEVIETRQDLIAQRIEELKSVQNNASVALENLNGTASYETKLEDYNNAVFYMHFVEEDGCLGIHNMEKANEYLDKSEKLFNSVTETEEPVEQPGFEAIVAVFGLMFMFWVARRRG
jgi:formate-dependent nitrite reductase cytochrome c552 subunit